MRKVIIVLVLIFIFTNPVFARQWGKTRGSDISLDTSGFDNNLDSDDTTWLGTSNLTYTYDSEESSSISCSFSGGLSISNLKLE